MDRWKMATRLSTPQTNCEPGSLWYPERVRITFTLRRGRLLDPDNAHSSVALKAIVDALKGVYFPDDKAACVEYGSLRQEIGTRYRHLPEVEVLLEEITPP